MSDDKGTENTSAENFAVSDLDPEVRESLKKMVSGNNPTLDYFKHTLGPEMFKNLVGSDLIGRQSVMGFSEDLVKQVEQFDKVPIEAPEVKPISIPPRPDPGLLRALIEETQKSNEQNEQIIKQNAELLQEARDNSKAAGRASKWAVIAGWTGIVSATAAIVAIVVTALTAH